MDVSAETSGTGNRMNHNLVSRQTYSTALHYKYLLYPRSQFDFQIQSLGQKALGARPSTLWGKGHGPTRRLLPPTAQDGSKRVWIIAHRCLSFFVSSLVRWTRCRRLWLTTPLEFHWWRPSGQSSPVTFARSASTQRYRNIERIHLSWWVHSPPFMRRSL